MSRCLTFVFSWDGSCRHFRHLQVMARSEVLPKLGNSPGKIHCLLESASLNHVYQPAVTHTKSKSISFAVCDIYIYIHIIHGTHIYIYNTYIYIIIYIWYLSLDVFEHFEITQRYRLHGAGIFACKLGHLLAEWQILQHHRSVVPRYRSLFRALLSIINCIYIYIFILIYIYLSP